MRTTGKNPWSNIAPPLIAPSLLACDFCRSGQQIDEVIAAGAAVLHIDIMDGHFVPNLSMGPGFAKSVRRYTDHPLDVHLMVTDPDYYIDRFADVGADSITFHIEAAPEPRLLIDRLHDLGLGAGITLRPATPAASIMPVINDVDLVLVMTVEPGYGGQKFMNDMLEKIRTIRQALRASQRLEVDGGINPQTARLCSQAGADTYVAGENIFGSGDIAAAVAALREAAS